MHITRIHVQGSIVTLVQHILANSQAGGSWGPLGEDELVDHAHDLCYSWNIKINNCCHVTMGNQQEGIYYFTNENELKIKFFYLPGIRPSQQ